METSLIELPNDVLMFVLVAHMQIRSQDSVNLIAALNSLSIQVTILASQIVLLVCIRIPKQVHVQALASIRILLTIPQEVVSKYAQLTP